MYSKPTFQNILGALPLSPDHESVMDYLKYPVGIFGPTSRKKDFWCLRQAAATFPEINTVR